MSTSPVGTIRTMLESVLEQVDDPELTFKLRTSLQLLMVIDESNEIATQSLEEADIDPETLENLARLGYLDP